MKMSYLLQHKDKRILKRRRIFFAVSISLALLVSLFYFKPSFFSGLAHSFAGPVLSVSEDIRSSVSSPTSFLTGKRELVAENEALKQKLKELEALSFDNKALEIENNELRDVLNMRPREDAVMARVLLRPPNAPYDILIIDGGRDMGLSEGDRVFFGESVLLGEIEEVYGRTSRVSLFSSAGRSTDVFVNDGDEIVSSLGRGGGKFLLEVPRRTEISEGDYLLRVDDRVSLLGVVLEVHVPETAGAIKFVYAGVPVDIFSLKEVFVIPSRGPEI